MKVKELLKILKTHNENNEVIFYNLKNHNLKEFQLETILDVDGRWEITTYEEGEYNNYISQFKDGVSDALLLGKSADVNLTSFYKQGYDFGMTMYCEMEGLDD